MKIRRLNESAEFNFNSAASSGNWPYKMSIETYANIRDEISQIIDNLDQSSVFAIARDANKLGLSIDEERLYYSPDATIETNISPEKINQFRNIVMRYSHEQLNEESNRKFYIDEIVSAPGGKTETERHSFTTLDELKQYCKDAGLTKDDIANCGGCDVKDLCEDIEKLHTKPNGEYLVKADSGKGYTAFSRDNVAIGGIDNEDADSDDKAIDKFKRNEYSECLNEAYFDTAEYRIQKYEDDIPELMAGMHDDYMEGKLAAEFYAKALEKVYNALADCDYKHTMSQAVKTETNSQKILNALDKAEPKTINDAARVVEENITEGAEKCYAAKYTAVDSEGNKTQKKICFMCDGTIEDAEKEVDALIKEPYTDIKVIGSVLKGVAEKDGFELVESILHEDKETISKFAQLAASHKFKNLKTQLEDDNTCVTCQGKLLPEDKNGIRKCESCGNFYFGKQLLICTKCGSTEIDPGRDCKCRHCGYEFAEDQGKCVTCGGDIVKNDSETNKCKHCGNLYDKETGKLIKKPTHESLDDPMYDTDEYDDEYDTAYNEFLEECSGIRAHKVIIGEDIDDVDLGDLEGSEGPTGDKTEDIEFVMAEYIPESFLIDAVKKLDSVTYEVSVEGKVVTVKFDPKWSEYVYTIDGRGPYSHRSYEFISRDIYDFVMSQRSADYELDDLED